LNSLPLFVCDKWLKLIAPDSFTICCRYAATQNLKPQKIEQTTSPATGTPIANAEFGYLSNQSEK